MGFGGRGVAHSSIDIDILGNVVGSSSMGIECIRYGTALARCQEKEDLAENGGCMVNIYNCILSWRRGNVVRQVGRRRFRPTAHRPIHGEVVRTSQIRPQNRDACSPYRAIDILRNSRRLLCAHQTPSVFTATKWQEPRICLVSRMLQL